MRKPSLTWNTKFYEWACFTAQQSAEKVDKDALMKLLKERAEQIKTSKGATKVLLFGSFARGDYTPSSDIERLL